MIFAYCRVSTAEQNLDRQIEALIAAGVDERNIYMDKISGAKESRPELDKLLSVLREGDTLIVSSFDRLARSTRQLLDLADLFQEKGVDFVSLKESVDTSSPHGKLFFTISAAFAEFEREIIRQRQAEGIAIAKANGRMKGRPKKDESTVEAAIELYKSGTLSVPKIAETTGVSKTTLYRELKTRGIQR